MLGDGNELAEPIGWPEISCTGEDAAEWQRGLTAKVREVVKENAAPILTFHRRLSTAEVRIVNHPLTLAAPERRADWREDIALQFHAAEWSRA